MGQPGLTDENHLRWGAAMTSFGESWNNVSHDLAASVLKRQGRNAPPPSHAVRIGPFLVKSDIPCPVPTGPGNSTILR
jgi:hypothetical protein